MNTNIDFYFARPNKWQKAVQQLRAIVLSCGLTEEVKWGKPCYTYQDNNILLIHDFKDYCALLFMKGALLHDAENILIQQTANVQSARQIRFTGSGEIVEREAIIKSYIYQAIEVEKAGLKVKLKKPEEFEIVEEFSTRLTENPKLKKAFLELTPGRQRAYYLFFAAPKQAKTRLARVEKCTEQILNGKGLNDE